MDLEFFLHLISDRKVPQSPKPDGQGHGQPQELHNAEHRVAAQPLELLHNTNPFHTSLSTHGIPAAWQQHGRQQDDTGSLWEYPPVWPLQCKLLGRICPCLPGQSAHTGSSDIPHHPKSAGNPLGYVEYTSKTSFYYKQKSISNLKLLWEGNKQSEHSTGDISKARTSNSLFKQQHYKPEIHGQIRISQQEFHCSRRDNYTKPQTSQRDIIYITFSSHTVAGIPQELWMAAPASATHRQN